MFSVSIWPRLEKPPRIVCQDRLDQQVVSTGPLCGVGGREQGVAAGGVTGLTLGHSEVEQRSNVLGVVTGRGQRVQGGGVPAGGLVRGGRGQRPLARGPRVVDRLPPRWPV